MGVPGPPWETPREGVPGPPGPGSPPGGRPGARGPGGVHFRGYLITLPVGTDVGIRNRKGWFSGGQKSAPGRPGAQNRPPGRPPGAPPGGPPGRGSRRAQKGGIFDPSRTPQNRPIFGVLRTPLGYPQTGAFSGPWRTLRVPPSVYPRKTPLPPGPRICHPPVGFQSGEPGAAPFGTWQVWDENLAGVRTAETGVTSDSWGRCLRPMIGGRGLRSNPETRANRRATPDLQRSDASSARNIRHQSSGSSDSERLSSGHSSRRVSSGQECSIRSRSGPDRSARGRAVSGARPGGDLQSPA